MNTKTPEQLAFETFGTHAKQGLMTPRREWSDIPKHEQDAWKAAVTVVGTHQLAQTLEAESDHPYRRTLLEQAFQEAQKRGVPVAVVLLDYIMGLKSDLLILAQKMEQQGKNGEATFTDPTKPTKPAEITDTTKPTKPFAGYPICVVCEQQQGPAGCWCDQRSK